jgi:hypothetical protein
MSKRSEFATYLNLGTTLSPDFELMGMGISNAVVNYNAKTAEEAYIHEDIGRTEIEGYAPTLPIEAKHIESDDVIAYLETMMLTLPTLDDAHGEIVNVRKWETPSGSSYPAQKQAVSIQFETFGGEAITKNNMSFTLNYLGAAVDGTFDVTAKTFTPSS